MKKKICMIICLMLCITMCMSGCSAKEGSNTAVVRIHIRANSSSEQDQQIKYKVRDSVIEYVTPLLLNACDVEGAKCVLSAHLMDIKSVSDCVLKNEGYTYTSAVKLNNEFFPTRSYSGVVYEANYYDALIIELGSGAGDNWWCVVYPPLCFSEYNGSSKVVYASKVWEIINKYFGG